MPHTLAGESGELTESLHHKVRTYKEYHLECPSSELGLPPTPHPQASVPPPPCFWGEGNTRWRERGWESPNSDDGHTLWYSLYVRTLCSTQCATRKKFRLQNSRGKIARNKIRRSNFSNNDAVTQ